MTDNTDKLPRTLPYLLLGIVLTALVYYPGLGGPFVFDDGVHVAQNTLVHIEDLSPASLVRAWHSSHAVGMSSRPLAQLTFGVNHAIGGLETWGYKATNLAIHALVGLMVFALSRRLCASLYPASDSNVQAHWVPLLVATLWLLHPVNLTSVLYVVQRMTSLSALFVFCGLWLHVVGRQRMAFGDRRGALLAASGLPVAMVGVLAKESAVLYPALVLVVEWTLLRQLSGRDKRLLVLLVGILPLVAGIVYLFAHPSHISYADRAFTLEQRLLSESRILWRYVQFLLLPDNTLLGLHHDDVAASRGVLAPWTTLPAVLGILTAVGTAVYFAKRWPVLAFSILFFLAGHSLESTIFPLELMFEHRNYLPSFGILFGAAVLVTSQMKTREGTRLLWVAMVIVVALLALSTYQRARDWSTPERLTLTEAENHPNSIRANFRLARSLISSIADTRDPAATYESALYYLAHIRTLAPDNLDALFGRIVLDLHVNRQPPQALVDDLVDRLRHGVVDPMHVNVSQFSYLIEWHMRGGYPLKRENVLAILTAALDNPGFGRQGRGSILSALRAYHSEVLKEPDNALEFATEAVRYWPERWHFHKRLIELLITLERFDEAREALTYARSQDKSATHTAEADSFARNITSALRAKDGVRR